jgi:hypothetical protein
MTRIPFVAGVAGGVGASSLAAALRAHDGGVYAGGPVDVVVCRTTVVSLGLAHEVAARAPRPPVLAVVADLPSTIPGPVRARMRMAEPHVHQLVAVPFVPEWRARVNPYGEAAHVLDPAQQIPRSLRDFARAMTRLVAALAGPLAPAAAGPPPATLGDLPADQLLTHPDLCRSPSPTWPTA